jgi:glycosyltransferase involved in cell wall biosynthesis
MTVFSVSAPPMQTFFLSTIGTPENWNEAVRQANGKWIKIMHDDDWFSGPASLTRFANAIKQNPDCAFIFSAYSNYFFDRSESQKVKLSSWWFSRLEKSPLVLFSTNLIGPPSVVIFKKSASCEFDPRLKWLVDIDFYIRLQAHLKPVYIKEHLVNVGISEEQVTASCFREPNVEIPESFHLLSKLGPSPFRNPFFYDGWWRLLRNLNIRSLDQIREAGYQGEVHPIISRMISCQRAIPKSLLKIGPVSKSLMFLSYLINS